MSIYPREAAISSLWEKHIRGGECLHLRCPTCGWPEIAKCPCAYKLYRTKLTEAEIQQEMRENERRRLIEREVAAYRKRMERGRATRSRLHEWVE